MTNTSIVFTLRRWFSSKKVKLLSIGLENCFAGNCPGAKADAKRLFNYVKPRCNYANLLLNSAAMKNNVVKEMQKVCDSDLAIITYAGHGTWTRGKTNETDGKDEMLVLFDTYMVDNEIWNIVSNAKGRVFLIFDCCFSETMFRELPRDSVDLLCWSACAEHQQSYGYDSGGVFTSSILKNVSWKRDYFQVWDKIVKEPELASRQTPKQTILLPSTKFAGKKIFS